MEAEFIGVLDNVYSSSVLFYISKKQWTLAFQKRHANFRKYILYKYWHITCHYVHKILGELTYGYKNSLLKSYQMLKKHIRLKHLKIVYHQYCVKLILLIMLNTQKFDKWFDFK